MGAEMSNIKILHTDRPEANLEVIDHLTDLLDRARKGEITEVIYSAFEADAGWSHGWTSGSSEAEILGAAELFKQSYMES